MMTMTGGASYPTPYDPPEAARAFFGPNADVLRIVAFLQFGAAIPLGLFTATVVSRLRFLGLTVAAISTITNMAAGLSDEKISHEHTKAMAPLGAAKLERILREFLATLR